MNRTEWSAAWEGELLRTIDDVSKAIATFRLPLKEYLKTIGLKEEDDCSVEILQRLQQLTEMLLDTTNEDFRIIFDKDFS